MKKIVAIISCLFMFSTIFSCTIDENNGRNPQYNYVEMAYMPAEPEDITLSPRLIDTISDRPEVSEDEDMTFFRIFSGSTLIAMKTKMEGELHNEQFRTGEMYFFDVEKCKYTLFYDFTDLNISAHSAILVGDYVYVSSFDMNDYSKFYIHSVNINTKQVTLLSTGVSIYNIIEPALVVNGENIYFLCDEIKGDEYNIHINEIKDNSVSVVHTISQKNTDPFVLDKMSVKFSDKGELCFIMGNSHRSKLAIYSTDIVYLDIEGLSVREYASLDGGFLLDLYDRETNKNRIVIIDENGEVSSTKELYNNRLANVSSLHDNMTFSLMGEMLYAPCLLFEEDGNLKYYALSNLELFKDLYVCVAKQYDEDSFILFVPEQEDILYMIDAKRN